MAPKILVVDDGRLIEAGTHGELIALGAVFDQDASGGLSLTREGGHHRVRVVGVADGGLHRHPHPGN